MKVGITLPQFSDDARAVLETAEKAETMGFDGVFCFDHLWPMGQPGRPAISSGPLLGAVVASTSTIEVGSLVARIGLVPDDVLVAVLRSLHNLSDGRFIAGIGTGDGKTRDENEAFGLPFEPAGERRARLVAVALRLVRHGVPVWLGGGPHPYVEPARSIGATINLWDATDEQVREVASGGVEVTWAGPVAGSVGEMADRLGRLEEAGAAWAVCGWPGSLAALAEAASWTSERNR